MAQGDPQWAALDTVAGKLGCTRGALWRYVQTALHDRRECGELIATERKRLRTFELDKQQLRRANEILHKAADPCRAGGARPQRQMIQVRVRHILERSRQ